MIAARASRTAAGRPRCSATRGRHATRRVARTAAAEVAALEWLVEQERVRQLQRPLSLLVGDGAEFEVAIDVATGAQRDDVVPVAALVSHGENRAEHASDLDLRSFKRVQIAGEPQPR